MTPKPARTIADDAIMRLDARRSWGSTEIADKVEQLKASTLVIEWRDPDDKVRGR